MKLRGDVLLTQGASVGKGEALTIDLNSGVAKFEGRVSMRLLAANASKDPKPDACGQDNLVETARQLSIADEYELVCVRKNTPN